MCALCTQELAGLSHTQVIALLPANHDWGRAGAAICLLSNLLEAGSPTLQVQCTGMVSWCFMKDGTSAECTLVHLEQGHTFDAAHQKFLIWPRSGHHPNHVERHGQRL